MHHKPFKSLLLRLLVALVFWGIMTLIISLFSLPQPYIWAMMATMLFYKNVARKII